MAVHPHLHSNHYFSLFIAFIHYSSALFPGKCSPRLSHQRQTAPFPLQCHAASLSSLCGIQPLKCQFTVLQPSPDGTHFIFLFLSPVLLSLSVFRYLYSLIRSCIAAPEHTHTYSGSLGSRRSGRTLRGEVQV